MNPKDISQRNKQRERRQRGHDFQQEVRNSWRLIPNTWQIVIKDGGGGSRPADNLVLAQEINILQELKRTTSRKFELSFLEPNQIRGLIDFDQVILNNYGMVLVSFHNPEKGLDDAYAIRLISALRYMNDKGRQFISLDELPTATAGGRKVAMHMPRQAGNTYDMQGVVECYKSL